MTNWIHEFDPVQSRRVHRIRGPRLHAVAVRRDYDYKVEIHDGKAVVETAYIAGYQAAKEFAERRVLHEK